MYMKEIVVVFMAAFATVSLADDCYVCAGALTSGCKETFDVADESSYSVVPGCSQCTKTKISAHGSDTVSRGCGACSATKIKFLGITTQTWCCSGDLCNGAGTLKVGYSGLMAAAILALMAVYRM